ncbi:fibronectin type III-like domain-contianing protein [Streptomyces acidicola]|uniref:fibronectin type III-like domain-contianing protein n=1 Tax=Streptomyces acidicola TaxID=2596892 RepID=UPI00381104F4
MQFKVTNTGKRAGTEVPQVYLELPTSTGEPAPRLISWKRVSLMAGQSKTVTIRLSAHEIANRHLVEVWDTADHQWQTPTGTFSTRVGTSSDTSLAANFKLSRN